MSNSNYDRNAHYDLRGINGSVSCENGSSVEGCIEPKALNYDSNANYQTTPCDHIDGCTYNCKYSCRYSCNQDTPSCKQSCKTSCKYNCEYSSKCGCIYSFPV